MVDDKADRIPGRKVTDPNVVKRKEFVELVQGRSGLNGKQAAAAVTAMLEILRETLEDGKTAVLPPLGKVMAKTVRKGEPNEKTQYRIALSRVRDAGGDAED
jgi:nucleoid DNA-binding protein